MQRGENIRNDNHAHKHTHMHAHTDRYTYTHAHPPPHTHTPHTHAHHTPHTRTPHSHTHAHHTHTHTTHHTHHTTHTTHTDTTQTGIDMVHMNGFVCHMHAHTPPFLRTFPLQEQWLSEIAAAQGSAVLHSEVEGERFTTLSPLRGEGHVQCALSSKLMFRRVVDAM